MARYTGKKNRIARRFGANIFGRKRNPLLHKAHPPGVHGAKRKKKSDYGAQLEEKQKLKACYGMLSEKSLVRYYKEAARQKGNTMLRMMQLLEARLDIVVYRMGFASTIFHAQQLVAHGHITVNGKKVDIRSFSVNPGMTVAIKEKSRKVKAITEAAATNGRSLPGYFEVSEDKLSGKMLAYPGSIEEVPLAIPVDVATVCEFVAHNN